MIVATVGLLTDKLLKVSLPLIILADAFVFIKRCKEINKELVIPIIGIIIYSIVQAIFYDSNMLLFKEITRNIVYLLILYGISNLYIDIQSYEKTWLYVLLFCLMIQLIQFFKIADINKYLSSFYGVTEDSAAMRVSNYDDLNLFRSGSIFVSINPYFKIVLVIFSMMLNKRIRSHIMKNERKITATVGIIASVVSALFIGSRTCFLILAMCMIEYIILYHKTLKHHDRRLMGFAVVLLIVLFAGGYVGKLFERVSNMRMFNIIQENGTTGSLEHKFGAIKNFFDNGNAISWLFGRGIYSASSKIEQMDGDFGYMFAYYGIFGIAFLFLIVRAVYIKGKNDVTYNGMLGIMWTTVLCMSVITSGVYLNMRVFGSLIVMCFVNKYSMEDL